MNTGGSGSLAHLVVMVMCIGSGNGSVEVEVAGKAGVF